MKTLETESFSRMNDNHRTASTPEKCEGRIPLEYQIYLS